MARRTEFYQSDKPLYDKAGHLTVEGHVVADTVRFAYGRPETVTPEMRKLSDKLEADRIMDDDLARHLAVNVEGDDRDAAVEKKKHGRKRAARQLSAAANVKSTYYLYSEIPNTIPDTLPHDRSA